MNNIVVIAKSRPHVSVSTIITKPTTAKITDVAIAAQQRT
jgi:hypothetical protein